MNIRCAVLNLDSCIQTNEENLCHIQHFFGFGISDICTTALEISDTLSTLKFLRGILGFRPRQGTK